MSVEKYQIYRCAYQEYDDEGNLDAEYPDENIEIFEWTNEHPCQPVGARCAELRYLSDNKYNFGYFQIYDE